MARNDKLCANKDLGKGQFIQDVYYNNKIVASRNEYNFYRVFLFSRKMVVVVKFVYVDVWDENNINPGT